MKDDREDYSTRAGLLFIVVFSYNPLGWKMLKWFTKILDGLDRGGGLVVRMLAFYYFNPRSNPAEVYSFYL